MSIIRRCVLPMILFMSLYEFSVSIMVLNVRRGTMSSLKKRFDNMTAEDFRKMSDGNLTMLGIWRLLMSAGLNGRLTDELGSRVMRSEEEKKEKVVYVEKKLGEWAEERVTVG